MYKFKQTVRVSHLPYGATEWDWSEKATIARRTKDMGTLPTGYHPVRFSDGGVLLVPESGLMADNAA